MRPDVQSLQAFYGTRQGQVVRRLVANRMRAMLPDLDGKRVLGLGYVGPYLNGLVEHAERTVMVMPAPQGACVWPKDGPNATALSYEHELPLLDRSIDVALLVHALECCERRARLLREVWRVLADDGLLLAVVPNRNGLWALRENTPFGQGQPFTSSQLKSLLGEHFFQRVDSAHVLYVPPTRSRVILRSSVAFERVGRRFMRNLGGLYMLSVTKNHILRTEQPAPVGLRALEMARRRATLAPIKRREAAAEPTAARTTALIDRRCWTSGTSSG